ncbi:helix-turn-helix transcriptional regulator [Alsobacter sp. SYSU M60028]|uniref:Helix-turn-helix transcriptional regulator n=1 Tax=Alsobacter ponti TaxID=2962936 RepID=A0ABT1L7J5_9HYPH|nr:helix-turn-helix transcriptional regulator [Alsobacter ponti]MCP8937455.1 helix-turn-helix transcriptional regulator [Alsobacter ponti]
MSIAASPSPANFGLLLRDWRQRRRISQLDLALEAEISSRHLSFIETGRARPSREMVLRLAEQLDVPLRERNALLLAAGFAPVYPERRLDDPVLKPVRDMIGRVLKGHEPFPAVAIDRHWTLVAANAAVAPLLAGASETLLAPPVNVLRLSLHPEGLAPRIANLPEWRHHLLSRLRRQVAESGDPVLAALQDELLSYPVPHSDRSPSMAEEVAEIAIPLQIATPGGVLSFLGTSMVFGTPRDVTVSEIAIEAFLPADEATANALSAAR